MLLVDLLLRKLCWLPEVYSEVRFCSLQATGFQALASQPSKHSAESLLSPCPDAGDAFLELNSLLCSDTSDEILLTDERKLLHPTPLASAKQS